LKTLVEFLFYKSFLFLTTHKKIKSIIRNNGLKADADLQETGYFGDNGTFYIGEIFTLTDKGLLFTYSPYEIPPYAAGMLEFTIPYTELKPYFTENNPLKRLME